MNPTIRKRYRWFWPWQDEKEEAWLEEMSRTGWHLKYVHLPCVYGFERGEPTRYSYRLDYLLSDKSKFNEYLQIFQDSGWKYLGEMSNWRYWRKQAINGETTEIFTDNQSKIKKYQRLLGFMGFFLLFLILMGINLWRNQALSEADNPTWLNLVYLLPSICYMVIIPIYVVVVIQLVRRIRQLRRSVL